MFSPCNHSQHCQHCQHCPSESYWLWPSIELEYWRDLQRTAWDRQMKTFKTRPDVLIWLLFALLLWTGGWTSNWVGQTSTKCCFAKCPLLFEQTGAKGQSREHLGGLVAKKQPNATSCFQQTVINLSKHKESGSTRSAAQPDDLCFCHWASWEA